MNNNHIENLKNWKSQVLDNSTLLVGIDVSKKKHDICFGTRDKLLVRKFTIPNDVVGGTTLLAKINSLVAEHNLSKVLIGLEPTSFYWKPLANFLENNQQAVATVDALSVFHNRKTFSRDTGKSDRKDAYCIYDLLGQRKFIFQSQEKDKHFFSKMMVKNWMNVQKEIIKEKNRLNALVSLVFPEFEDFLGKSISKRALLFLEKYPLPFYIARLSENEFIQGAQEIKRGFECETLKLIYQAAKKTFGVHQYNNNPSIVLDIISRIKDSQIREKKWQEACLAAAQNYPLYEEVIKIKGMGNKTTPGIILSLGDYTLYTKGSQITKLAGLNLIDKKSGSSINKPSHISHQGSKILRYWAYASALQVIKFDNQFSELYKRKKMRFNGRGSGKKALIAVSDKLLKVIWAMAKKGEPYRELKK